ncbi:hypothetical protein TBR22_A46540 [Luteitalea sp. TBR-22]|uniref:RDD family protein n=1 Tax=Luteitalea sp. TBR-22 TaxID=2802971 RepID=UPI001AF46DA9|nr:RDD family protein [Luteitalea sp. TBR-22]BCS35427.1 hypothetical protein TBR22_A46540 [Luteitalea sp. TBR-22]
MAGRTFDLVTHQVVDDSLLGRELAPPLRRLLAFGIDVALIAVPTVIAAILWSALALRVSDRPAYDALRAILDGRVRTEAQSLDAMTALLPTLVDIGAQGLPLEAITAVHAGRPRDGAAYMKDVDMELSLTFSDDARAVKPGHVRVPVAKFVPDLARWAALFGVPALYFTLLGLTPWGSIGKRLLGLEIRRIDGQPMTLGTAFDRFGGYASVPGTLFTGLTDLWRDPNRRLAHDRGAGTVVLRRQSA